MMEIRPLTRGEIKKLRAAGLYVTQLSGEDDRDRAEESIDAVLEMVIGPEAAAALPNPEANRIYLAVLAATYGSTDAEKNSSRSGTGTATRSEPDTAASAGATSG